MLMLKLLRRRRSLLAAIATGLMAVPALFTGVAAAPSEAAEPLEPTDWPWEYLPPESQALSVALEPLEEQRLRGLVPEPYKDLVHRTARRHGLDPALLAAVITVESDWDPRALGGWGEIGLMQILPSTARFLARWAKLESYDLYDPATNLELGALYLSRLLHQYGSPAKALAAYNGGPRAVADWQRNSYAQKVLRVLESVPVPAKPPREKPGRETA